MTQAIRKDFHTDLASTVVSDIQFRRSNLYYFIGKIESWGGADTAPGTIQADSPNQDLLIRSNAVYCKKINQNDVSLVTTRHDWVTGQQWDRWDDSAQMSASNFYCVVNNSGEYSVYKCLDNGKTYDGNIPLSTVKPAGKSLSAVRTADGYLWKFMYDIPSFKYSRFANSVYIPVQKSLSDSFYGTGVITGATVISNGTGYSSDSATIVNVIGTTTGSGATATVSAVNINGAITGLTIGSGGTGYTLGVNVGVVSGTGVGASITATRTAGVVTGLTIVAGGVGYSIGDTLSFSVGGAVVIPSVNSTTGSIEKLTIANAGVGYTGACTLMVGVGVGQTPGTGKYGNATAVFSGLFHNGQLVTAAIIDPGINYPYSGTTTITVTGDGTGAILRPVVYGGRIIDVYVESSGEGYTTANAIVVGSGSNATVSVNFSENDFKSNQSTVEQVAVPGEIHAWNIQEAGTNYLSNTLMAPTNTVVTVTGDGSGCTVEPIVVSGKIIKLNVLTPGQGYTHATVSVSCPGRITAGAIDFQATPIMPPVGGHGADAVSELYADTLSINSYLKSDYTINGLGQDYRQFGLLNNPRHIITKDVFKENSQLITHNVTFYDTTGLIEDEILSVENIRFRVVDVSGLNVKLQSLSINPTPPTGTLQAIASPSRTYTVHQIISQPTVDKYSGKLLYVSNEDPFVFTDEQAIVIKTYIKF